MLLVQSKIKKLLTILVVLLFVSYAKIDAQTDTIQTTVPHLKTVFAKDFYIGCLLSYRNIGFPDDPIKGSTPVSTPNGGYLIKYHMNSMSPGNNMKPQYTVDLSGSAAAYNSASAADKDSVDTHPVIKFNSDMIAQLAWAKRQGFTFRGHTLVWHSQTPGTGFFRTGYSASASRLTKEKMTQRLENYIKEVIRLIHEGWPGLLSAFDVVNEAVNENGSDRDASSSEWYQTFGDNTYLMKAFEFARKYTVQYGETQIKLYYNDYNTSTSSKADGIVRICKPIYDAGFLDGIGMQEHDQYNSPSANQWIATYNKFYPICNEMAVTELDVKPSSPTITSSVLTSQANQYAMLIKCFVERSYFSGRGKIISVCKDGLNDSNAFVANASLWDSNNQCKPAFYSVVDVGINYNKLDSLITYAGGLVQTDYTNESWTKFSAALTSAQAAKDQNYSYSVSAATSLGNAKDSLNTAIDGLVKSSTDVKIADGNIPEEFKLGQNYPNPFNPATHINYSIPRSGFVTLKVYNLLGEEIATLFEGMQQAGNYVAKFNSTGLASGIYLYRFSGENFVETKKLVVLK